MISEEEYNTAKKLIDLYEKQQAQGQMDSWVLNYVAEQWEDADPSINFDELEPFDTSNSLHIYEEKYKVEDDTYRLLYVIGNDGPPSIEKLIL